MDCSGAELVARVRASVGAALTRTRLIEAADPIIVAVSGGADSLCLLDAVAAVVPRAEHRLVVAYVDHRLRPESAADAEHVRGIAAALGLRAETVTVDVPSIMAGERRGLEEAARLGRYRALRDLGARLGAAAVVTGHTRDDSIETVLMHLLRGSGRTGLGGIAEEERMGGLFNEADADAPWERGHAGGDDAGWKPALPGLRLVRPLLRIRRAETTDYCDARGIRWLVDPTNADPSMLRNRVRGHLLPVLRTYNPAIDDALDRLARLTRDEEQPLDALADERYRHLAREGGGLAELDLSGWRATPGALQRRIVRRIAAEAGLSDIGFEAVERALAVGTEGGPPRAELGHGLVVERRRDRLRFYDRQREGTL